MLTRGRRWYRRRRVSRSPTTPADPGARATHHMVDAYHDFWAGNLDEAIRAAEQALAIDPVNVHALRFLIASCHKAGSPKANQYRAILDEIDHE